MRVCVCVSSHAYVHVSALHACTDLFFFFFQIAAYTFQYLGGFLTDLELGHGVGVRWAPRNGHTAPRLCTCARAPLVPRDCLSLSAPANTELQHMCERRRRRGLSKRSRGRNGALHFSPTNVLLTFFFAPRSLARSRCPSFARLPL